MYVYAYYKRYSSENAGVQEKEIARWVIHIAIKIKYTTKKKTRKNSNNNNNNTNGNDSDTTLKSIKWGLNDTFMTNRGIQVFRKAVVVRIFHAHVFDFTYKKKCNCTQAVDPNQTTVNINNENNAVNELCVFRMMSSRIERERGRGLESGLNKIQAEKNHDNIDDIIFQWW